MRLPGVVSGGVVGLRLEAPFGSPLINYIKSLLTMTRHTSLLPLYNLAMVANWRRVRHRHTNCPYTTNLGAIIARKLGGEGGRTILCAILVIFMQKLHFLTFLQSKS